MPRLLLHLEGAAFLIVATLFYFQSGGGWLLFVLLFLAPDVAMVGYLAGPRIGSICYNIAHTYVLPLSLMAVALLLPWELGIRLSLIWIAHLGLDRMLGYGLKYPTHFKDTHLSNAEWGVRSAE